MKTGDLQSADGIPSHSCSSPVCFSVKEIIKAENQYCARSWDKELATRYIFNINNAIVEASFFRHFRGRKFVKDVLELPISYGCVIGCRHCASSQLHNTRFLSFEELFSIFRYVTSQHIPKSPYIFRVSFAGIGEGALKPHLIQKVIPRMLALYPNCFFTLTTSGCNPKFISLVDELAHNFPVQYLQITYLHSDINHLSKIIPKAFDFKFDFCKVVNAMEHACNLLIRLNYVVIKDFNDDLAVASHVADCIRHLKNKITVRISRMNETIPSRTYGLEPPSIESLTAIREIFDSEGITAYVFAAHHDDNLNCGQLAGKYQ